MKVSTRDAAPAEQADRWQSVIDDTFVPLEFRPAHREPAGFSGELEAHTVDGIDFMRVRAEPHTVDRSPSTIRRASSDVLFVMIPRSGRLRVSQDGRIAELAVADMATYDAERPCSITSGEPFDLTIAKVPVPYFAAQGLPTPAPYTTAVRIDRHSDLGSLASPFLSRLADLGANTPMPGVRSATMDLLFAALNSACPEREGQSSRTVLRLQAQRLIRENLGDPDLAPVALARQLHVSVRSLELAFAEDGVSPARWIARCRIQRAAELLRSPTMAAAGVTDIALLVGFGDPSRFSRAFKDHHGVAPRAFRHDGPPAPRLAQITK